MTNDPNKREDGERPRTEKFIRNETIEQIRDIYFGGVGYKRPPKETRFKKGQSGNPKGRPKTVDMDSDRSANSIALKEGERPISVREGTEIRDMPTINAVVRKQAGTALSGNAYAQKHVIERYDRAERERRQRIAKEVEIYTHYVETRRAEIAEAKAKGLSIPGPLPHPDDVIIDPEKGVTFVGPFTEEGRTLLEDNRQYRDALIMQHILDQRLAGNIGSTDLLDQPGSALAFAQVMNRSLPERYRLSDMVFAIHMDRYATWSKRKLLKEVHRAWRALGVRVPRGRTFPPLRLAMQRIDEMFECLTSEHNEDVARFIAQPRHVQIDTMGMTRRKFCEDGT